MIIRLAIIVCIIGFHFSSFGQSDLSVEADSNKPSSFLQRYLKSKSAKVSVGGYYRMYMYHRYFDEAYPDILLNTGKRVVSVFDGYFDPNLQINVTVTPNNRTSISTDFFLFTPYSGNSDGNLLTNNIMLNLSGSIRTDFGRFGVRAGGIYWYTLSTLTMGSVAIDKYSLFTRTPYDAAGKSYERYNSFYETGVVNQDERFIFQAFKGFTFDGTGLPGDMSFKFLFGKNSANLNNESVLASEVPNYMTGGQIHKTIKGKNGIAFNNLNSFAFDDTANAVKRGFNLLTLSHRVFAKEILFEGEFGFGRYQSDTYPEGWGHGWNLEISTPKSLTYIPLSLQLFHIDKNFVNNIGGFSNTSISEVNFLGSSSDAQTLILQPFASPINQIGYLANNRFGLNFDTEVEVLDFKFSLGYSISSEKERLSDDISYSNRINGLTISRFFPFSSNQGPYERIGTYYRGSYENVEIKFDSTGNNKKFNTVEFQAKYKFEIGDRNMYFFYFGSLNSVQSTAKFLPQMNNKSWVRMHYHEVEGHFQIFPNTFLAFYYGFQRSIGNSETNLDSETFKSRDQTDRAIGIGLDIDISKNTGLYLRHRWFKHQDVNFGDDLLQGKESIFELKTYF